MTTTLQIEVNQTSGVFRFDLSYKDENDKVWTGLVADGNTIGFTENGKYTLKNGSDEMTFTFDDLKVSGGSTVNNAVACNSGGPYDLGSIPFPTLRPGETQVASPYAWCQQYTTASLTDDLQLNKPTAALLAQQAPAAAQRGGVVHLKDPKLGLSNTTTTTKVNVTKFPSCSCSSGSG